MAFKLASRIGVLAMAGLATHTAVGEAVIYEPFEYAAGPLNGQSGAIEVGLDGTWSANSTTNLVSPGLTYGQLATGGGAVGNLSGGQNRPGGTRAISPAALAGNGLLDDGVELWFSVIMGYDAGGNRTNSRLAFSLGSTGFNNSNFSYVLDQPGATGLGVTLGRFDGANGKVVATEYRDGSVGGTSGFADNVFGNTNGVVLSGDGSQIDSLLVVGRITWGASSDTIDIFLPDTNLNLGSVHSSLTVNVDQSGYDTISFKRGDKVVMDEIRFGATLEDVTALPDPLRLQVDTVTGQIKMIGDDNQSIFVNYLQISSAGNSLNPVGWNSLTDQDFDGNGPANGTGNGWEEAGGSSAGVLAEAFLLGNSEITAGSMISLGNAYNTSVNAQDLAFSYLNEVGQELEGVVEYVQGSLPGDTDGDGDVDDSDLGVSFSNYTGPGGSGKTAADGDTDGDGDVDDGDLGVSFSNYTGPLGPAVPEPASLALLGAGVLATLRRRAR